MLFWPDEKDVEEKLLKHEVDELREYAEKQGFTKAQAETFVRNSISNSARAEYESIGASEDEIWEHINAVLKKAGLEYDH